ncbi:hypothetical protein [Sorangium cellulosum]|uniref:hypothetical protein n=1 Tax=Sorangium cellulosum TaxID=56 RepID=UPI0003FE2FE5|nr:hypothetical protein [Sorangium cellulosum]
MTTIASLSRRAALAAAALLSGSALLASCAGTLDEDFKEEYAAGGDEGAGAGDGQGATTATGAGGAPSATTGGDAVTTGDAATTGGDAAATTGGGPATCAEAPALIATSCGFGGCHDEGTKVAGIVLAAGFETNFRDQPSQSCGGSVLVPGQPDMSSLYMKLMDDPPCGVRMPFNMTPFNEEQKACVRDWIAALPP